MSNYTDPERGYSQNRVTSWGNWPNRAQRRDPKVLVGLGRQLIWSLAYIGRHWS